jgi:hypothetical protein
MSSVILNYDESKITYKFEIGIVIFVFDIWLAWLVNGTWRHFQQYFSIVKLSSFLRIAHSFHFAASTFNTL